MYLHVSLKLVNWFHQLCFILKAIFCRLSQEDFYVFLVFKYYWKEVTLISDCYENEKISSENNFHGEWNNLKYIFLISHFLLLYYQFIINKLLMIKFIETCLFIIIELYYLLILFILYMLKKNSFVLIALLKRWIIEISNIG